jgi:cytosine/adenosine deaminase-related metal-dependent hydrolase
VRSLLSLLGIAVFFAACAHRGGAIVIEHVNVVDVAAGVVRPDRRVIDGTGKFLIPGLWDMHVHLADKPALGEFLRWGIVGIRDMGNDLPDLLALRQRIECRSSRAGSAWRSTCGARVALKAIGVRLAGGN